MPELSLTEISQRYSKNRTTIYRDIKIGKLSRKANGMFDLVEVIRVYGEMPTTVQNVTATSQTISDSDRKLISVLESELAFLKQQIEQKDKVIDRLQNLLEHKPSNVTNNDANNISNDTYGTLENIRHEQEKQHEDETSKNVTLERDATVKKRGLFSRVLKAVLD